MSDTETVFGLAREISLCGNFLGRKKAELDRLQGQTLAPLSESIVALFCMRGPPEDGLLAFKTLKHMQIALEVSRGNSVDGAGEANERIT